jgi:hypothetical protein
VSSDYSDFESAIASLIIYSILSFFYFLSSKAISSIEVRESNFSCILETITTKIHRYSSGVKGRDTRKS